MKIRFNIRNRYVLIGDLGLIIVSVLGAFVLRLEVGASLVEYLPVAYWMIGVALVIKPLTYYLFGLYRRMWAYASTQELKLIFVAVTAAEIPVALIMLALWRMGLIFSFSRSVQVIDWALSILAVIVVYLLLRGTYFGLRLKAVGKNMKAAFLMGVPTWQYSMFAFMLCGAFAGLSGAIQVALVIGGLLATLVEVTMRGRVYRMVRLPTRVTSGPTGSIFRATPPLRFECGRRACPKS